ncbi:MAG: AAA family ATPase [Myxococcales bacterium]|nr:AAA family ATPase [Myxococcales bacterium]
MARVLVCCGVGGTGKTTTSAALGVAQARAGHRVVVLTIDPARRLADALGLDRLDNEPRPVALPEAATGSLSAMMLDRKGTWDAVIRSRASADTAQRLLANPYYRALSTRLSGSHEFMAVEKLHDLVHSGAFDVVVLDTPPTQHVVDFFRAPQRVRGLLDRSLLASLLDPARVRGAAARGAFAVIRRLAGRGVMDDLRSFFELFAELSAGFRERSAAIEALLSSPETAYLLVAHADAPERNDLLGFLDELRQRGMTFAGFLVNRVQLQPAGDWPDPAALLAASSDPAWPAMVQALLALPEQANERARRHQQRIRALVDQAGGAPAWLVPEVAEGARSLDALWALSEHLPPTEAAIR